jgi:SNF2 family DNA or RNA helicase
MGLSATPIYNYGGEFFNVLDVLAPGKLGARPEFMREWCHGYYDERKARILDPRAFGTYLREAGLMVRHTKKEVGRELPSLSKIVQPVESDPKHLKKIESAATELARFIMKANENRTKGFDVMKASQEFSNTMRQATGIAKAPFVAEFVRMLQGATEEKLVLFGWHREVYSIWEEKLHGLNPAWFTGSESPSKKQKEIDRFLIDDDCKLLIMSLRSGSGVDGLQNVCSRVIIGELDWSPGAIEQCIGRVHRDGQKEPVFAYYLTAEDGADPIMIDVLGVKRSQLEGVKNPHGDLIKKSQIDPDHVKKLAEGYLKGKK